LKFFKKFSFKIIVFKYLSRLKNKIYPIRFSRQLPLQVAAKNQSSNYYHNSSKKYQQLF